MEDISKEYIVLFRAISETIHVLEQVCRQLEEVQMLSEQLYIEKDAS